MSECYRGDMNDEEIKNILDTKNILFLSRYMDDENEMVRGYPFLKIFEKQIDAVIGVNNCSTRFTWDVDDYTFFITMVGDHKKLSLNIKNEEMSLSDLIDYIERIACSFYGSE